MMTHPKKNEFRQVGKVKGEKEGTVKRWYVKR